MKINDWFFIAAFFMLIADAFKDDLFDDSILATIFCTAWIIYVIEKKEKQ